jgi:hypothetical protein
MSDTYHATQENTNLTAGFPARTNGDPLEKDFSNGHNGTFTVHLSSSDNQADIREENTIWTETRIPSMH